MAKEKLYEVIHPLGFERKQTGTDKEGKPTYGPAALRQPGEKVQLSPALNDEQIDELVKGGIVRELGA
jgi:hypothetical protein